MGKQFSVDPKALNAVAEKVEALLSEVNGGSGYIAGNSVEFASVNSIEAPLATFWAANEDVFAGAYADAHGAITTTFQQIEQQLGSIAKAARAASANYHNNDETTKQQVKKTSPTQSN